MARKATRLLRDAANAYRVGDLDHALTLARAARDHAERMHQPRLTNQARQFVTALERLRASRGAAERAPAPAPAEALGPSPLVYAVQAYHAGKALYATRHERLQYAARATERRFGVPQEEIYRDLSDYLRS
jgi:hypothetical protein